MTNEPQATEQELEYSLKMKHRIGEMIQTASGEVPGTELVGRMFLAAGSTAGSAEQIVAMLDAAEDKELNDALNFLDNMEIMFGMLTKAVAVTLLRRTISNK